MYRKPSSTSVLSGVPSGPYTGGKRVIDGALLESATRERLDKVLALRGQPAPITYERPVAYSSSRPVWGIIGATMGLSTLFATGFGNLNSDWAMHPWWSIAIYLAFGLLFARSLLPLLRRRVLFGGGARGALRPGRYLFPLDAVDIGLPDAAGRQLVTVRPLGDARNAGVEIDGRRVELVVRFEDGELVRFPLRGDHEGTVALRRLEHAQRLLEDLTYKNKLEEAFANDIFFDIRVDKAWARFEPGAAPAPARAPNLISLALGRLAPVLIAAVTLALGAGTFFVRREAGDSALYNHAMAYATVDGVDRYLARGGLRRLAAEDVRQRLVEAEKERDRRDDDRKARDHAGLGAFDAIEDGAIDQKCIEALQARANPQRPKAVTELAAIVKGGGRRLYVKADDVNVGRDADVKAEAVPDLTAAFPKHARILETAFAHALSDLCPESVLRLAPATPMFPRIELRVRPQWLARSWRLTDAKGAPFVAHQLHFELELALVRGDREHSEKVESFTLSLPPPAEAVMAVRPQSLFALGGEPVVPGVYDDRVYYAMIARAYDRLYDELWSLFFAGDPRVPLVPAAVLRP